MLLIKRTIIQACPEGTNLAEQTETGRRRMETIYGPKYDPILECVAVGGTPFASLTEVRAPIALRLGDEIAVDADNGYMVEIKRNGSILWPKGGKEDKE